MASELASAIIASSQRLGINPSDLATAMSYETGGKMDPDLWGGAGGKHLGLIQFGPEEQQKYGVKPGMPLNDHVMAAESFLRDRGIKPGMGMMDIYSTINAGRPGLYNASDAKNGGAPGTVADKVASMAPHRAAANTLLGLSNDAPSGAAPMGPIVAPAATPAAPNQQQQLMALLSNAAKQPQAGGVTDEAVPPQMQFAQPPAQAAIRQKLLAQLLQQAPAARVG